MLTVITMPSAAAQASCKLLVRQLCVGFGYWLAFVLVLEPGNLLHGSGFVWSQEIIRMVGAGMLGALATPVLFTLVRRYPIEGAHWQRRFAVQAVAAVVTAAVLIVLSCLLADRFLASERRPLSQALPQEFAANWLLLCFVIAGLLVGVHAARFAKHAAASPKQAKETYLTRVTIRERGRVRIVELADVTRIEAQANYVALHTASGEHLVRQSLSNLERQLNPDQFVRIHRSVIVSTSALASLVSLGAGDAKLLLKDGTELRLSRVYRDRLALHFNASASL